MAKYFRMEKEGETCYSQGGKPCGHEFHCPQVSYDESLICERTGMVFIEDTIIPQKLALYEEMFDVIQSINRGKKPYVDESGYVRVRFSYWRDLQSIIDRAQKITEE